MTRREYTFPVHTLNLGDAVRTATNPFTGKRVEFPVDDGFDEAEVAALESVFEKRGIVGPEPDHEGYVRRDGNGGSLRFRRGALEAGPAFCGATVELIALELDESTLDTLLEMGRRGNMAFTSIVGDEVRIVDAHPSEAQRRRWPDAVGLFGADELRRWLDDVIGYRSVEAP